MIRHAKNAWELAWNWASIPWTNGKNIRVSDARADFADYKSHGGIKPFYAWVEDCHYNLIEEPPDEED